MLKTRTTTGLLGVDIGSHVIKMAQVEHTGTGFRIVDAAVIPRRTPWVFENWLNCFPITSAQEIMTARTAGQFKGKNVAATATMALCDVRKVKLNSHDEDNFRRQAIDAELEKIERFAGEARTYDYWEICLLYTSPSPRDATLSRMPSSA